MTTQERLDVLNLNEREVTEEYRGGKIDLATFVRRREYYRGKIEGLMTGATQRMEEEVDALPAAKREEAIEQTDKVDDAYRSFLAADNEWSRLLQAHFGKNAGDVRYTKRGQGVAGSELNRAFLRFAETREIWQEATDAKRNAETVCVSVR